MTDSVISVRNVSKAYSRYDSPRDVIKEAILGGVRHDVFWALKNVSLEVREGQRIGIIGPNGAGKSTLLKLITGNLQQTEGEITVTGKVSALLSLTSFLSPDETGLENIRFNLIVNGARKTDIPQLTEEIIDFTELGAFIHAPVRTYSTGMNARLAFAISTAITPDILVVDEVLSAGDAYFANKATLRMIDLCKQGRALLFVSHAMNAIQLLCNTAVWMDAGSIREIGDVDEIARRYEADFRRQEDESVREGNQARRARLVNRVSQEESARTDVMRLRLIGSEGRIMDTHYVRKISVDLDGESFRVPLAFADIDDEGTAASLDVIQSEWGRPHERKGSETRVLSASSRPFRGGHILVTSPDPQAGHTIGVTFESASLGSTEELVAQWAKTRSGEWVDLDLVERQEVEKGWCRSRFRGELVAGAKKSDEHLAHTIADVRPDIEILETFMLVNDNPVFSVREGRPFTVAVRIRGNRDVPLADVGLTIIRSDGFYVFWQSSGQVGANLENVRGQKVVLFRFDPNIFGPGDYEVTTEIANGFDVERNFPYSEIFDRKVNDLKFTVVREWPLLMRGAINYSFPVHVEEGEGADNGGQPTRKLSSSELQ